MKNEFNSFTFNLHQEITGLLNSLDEDGGTPESIFTEYCLNLLEENDLTECATSSFDEKHSGRGIEHKVNGFAIHNNYDTLDLFITDYEHIGSLTTFQQRDFELCITRLTKFLQNSIYNNYIEEKDESCEIFELLYSLQNTSLLKENLCRINFFILTNKFYDKEFNSNIKVAGYSVKLHLYDISNLFKISSIQKEDIVINFNDYKYKLYCVKPQVENESYYSLLTAIPGNILWEIYDKFNSRILEQNVRSFLQFSGKINQGIRSTILNEPDMFMAFNNGISATANEVILNTDENGLFIEKIIDFQIVNGGQTTASIYHTGNKDKRVSLDTIFVPTKINIIKKTNQFETIVSRIAEYSNTQNKVSLSDLSSNKENHIILESLSRRIWAPPKSQSTIHTRWFYERSRGQYRNEKNRNSSSLKLKKQFEIQNPRYQLISKEFLAKYFNSYFLKWNGKKPLIGPHIVVRGSQKNYLHFLKDNFNFKPNKLWWEDIIGITILFKTAENIYGIKPNALGDLRFAVVPYTISYLSYISNGRINLESIWKNQSIDVELQKVLRDMMIKIEEKIKSNASGSLYAEYAKKQECWEMIYSSDELIAYKEKIQGFVMTDDIYEIRQRNKRKSENETISNDSELELIKSYKPHVWTDFSRILNEISTIPQSYSRASLQINRYLRTNQIIEPKMVKIGLEIIDYISEYYPIYFTENLNPPISTIETINTEVIINVEVLNQMMVFANENRLLSPKQTSLLFDLAKNLKPLNEYNKKFAENILRELNESGFKLK